MTTPDPVPVDAEALAIHLGVPASTIRWWAVVDHWTPYGKPRARKWDLREARASFDSRRGQSAG